MKICIHLFILSLAARVVLHDTLKPYKQEKGEPFWRFTSLDQGKGQIYFVSK